MNIKILKIVLVCVFFCSYTILTLNIFQSCLMCSFNRYLLSIYYVFGTILNSWNTMLYNRGKVFSSFGTHILVGNKYMII